MEPLKDQEREREARRALANQEELADESHELSAKTAQSSHSGACT